MELTKSEFARQCGVSPAAVTTAVKKGLLFQNSGGRLETENPKNRAYLDRHYNQVLEKGIPPHPSAQTDWQPPTERPPALVQAEAAESAGLAGDMMEMTISELIKKHGSTTGIKEYAKILQLMASTSEKEIRIRERRLLLIEKDFVKSQLFAYIDTLMNKLLDYPDGAASVIIAKIQSGGENARPEIVSYLRDGMARCISDAKTYIINQLESLKGKYDTVAESVEEMRETLQEMKDEKENL